MAGTAVRSVTPDQARSLVDRGDVRVLDVRTPGEHARLGHIPGSILLPVDLIAVAPATLPRDDRPLLVYCEHGVRSAHAAVLLARAGFPDVINMTGGMSCWTGPRDHAPGNPFGPHGPSSWVAAQAGILPRGGHAIDIACGRGRHALLLASLGMKVDAIDRDAARCDALRAMAGRLGLDVRVRVADLESEDGILPEAACDAVVGVHFLHRPLFPALVRALRRGGVLIWETFLEGHEGLGGPTSPHHLLKPGELTRLVEGLTVLDRREGEFDGRWVSAIAARRDSHPARVAGPFVAGT